MHNRDNAWLFGRILAYALLPIRLYFASRDGGTQAWTLRRPRITVQRSLRTLDSLWRELESVPTRCAVNGDR